MQGYWKGNLLEMFTVALFQVGYVLMHEETAVWSILLV